jgi:hypothetical protein
MNSLMSLEQLQRTMAAAVMQPLSAEDQMKSHSSAGQPMSEVAGQFIQPNSRLSAFERLEIYNRQYWFRLQGAFADDFPALRSVIGSDRFEALANAYLEAHPSRSFTLRNLGSKLHEWITLNPKWAGPRLALALDVVSVEWACIEAFDNAQLPPLTTQEATSIHGESRLSLQPHVQLLALTYPADDLVLAMHQHQKREVSEAGSRPEDEDHEPDERMRLRKRSTWLALHRSDLSIYYKRLTHPEYRMLAALRDGFKIQEALEAAFIDSRLIASIRIRLVQQWFSNWAELGWICNPQK